MGNTGVNALREPWNKGKIVGQKAPFKLKDIWALRVRFQMEHRVRELALFNLGIDSKLRGCDLVALKVRDVCHGDQVATRAIVLQHNPPPVIELTLARLLHCLKPGGVAVFQLPTHIPGYRFVVAEYLQALRAGQHQGMEMHMLPQTRVFEVIDAAGCQPCEVISDEAAGPVYTSHTFVVRARR